MQVATTVNGIEVENLVGAIELLTRRPELGNFKFKTSNNWIDGTFNRASNPAAEEQLSAIAVPGAPKRTKPHVHDIDEPPVLLGSDRGANPVEYLLTGLSGCV